MGMLDTASPTDKAHGLGHGNESLHIVSKASHDNGRRCLFTPVPYRGPRHRQSRSSSTSSKMHLILEWDNVRQTGDGIKGNM